ncbi:MAG: GAF domain-containing protein [Deltaproteobacteria bacterium]|nr:GAF domain-containing protein [Deltaproteobacteria bacterium]
MASTSPQVQDLLKRIEELERELAEKRQAETSLRRSQRRLRMLLDFVPYPLAVMHINKGVFYLNHGFTNVFGWTLDDLVDGQIPFVPKELEREAKQDLQSLISGKGMVRRETRRLTKDGRILDVVMRAAYYEESEYEPAGILMIFRDITEQKRIARINEMILRISTALPEYPDLEALLDYVNDEVKNTLNTEGAVVILLDQEKQELFVLGAAYDDQATQRRVKEIRFKMDELVAGRVIKSGKPIIVSDTSQDAELHRRRDEKLGYRTRNLLLVPLRSGDRIIGVVCALNKKEGDFEQKDVELLNTIAGTVALSVENARVNEELKKAYREVRSLNRAKDRVINHLSHELKTPVSILLGSLRLLEKTLGQLPEETWKRNFERMRRNLDRIVDIQYEVTDIMEERRYRSYDLLLTILEQCADELEVLIAEELGEGGIIEKIRKRIDEIFGLSEARPGQLDLGGFVKRHLEGMKTKFAHREVHIIQKIEPTSPIYLPPDILEKVVEGLVRNAVENTPDEGKIEIAVQRRGQGSELVVRDYGVGIVQEAQSRIFEGFFSTQDTISYSSKRPFDFNAGGRGADLLRMKIFSERYGFKIEMESTRCRFIPTEKDICPGRISKCQFCDSRQDCFTSGGTVFRVYFPQVN